MDGMLKIKRQSPREAESLIPETLAGFPGIHVWVSQVDPDLAADGLDRESLWRQVQKKLAQAGLPVPKQHGMQQIPLFPCLGVLIHADKTQALPAFYVFSVEVFYVQKINLAGAPSANAMRMAWCREAIGDVQSNGQGFDWSVLHHTVGSLVDQFLEESLGLSISEKPARICN
jgi:hypothetical protein